MQIILTVPQDPTDIMLQGAVIGDVWEGFPLKPTNEWTEPNGWIPSFLQGFVIGDSQLGSPVPRAMIGQHPWYGLPAETGLFRLGNGQIEMVPLGDRKKRTFGPYVNETRRFLNSEQKVDITGADEVLEADVLGAPEAIPSPLMGADSILNDFREYKIPRSAILMSGLAKRTTCPVLPGDFGQRLRKAFVESTTQWKIIGVTRDGGGAALGSCTVYFMRSDKLTVSPDQYGNPIIGIKVSDASGNYEFQVSAKVPHQLTAYLPGSPDVAGITRVDVDPTVV
jgi:hypothetical protein